MEPASKLEWKVRIETARYAQERAFLACQSALAVSGLRSWQYMQATAAWMHDSTINEQTEQQYLIWKVQQNALKPRHNSQDKPA